MIVGVPLFGENVAPRFCSASEALLIELSGDCDRRVTRVPLVGCDCKRRLNALRGLGVDVLLCGGFNRRFLPLATGLELEVYWGLEGDAVFLVERLVKGEIRRHHAAPNADRVEVRTKSAGCERAARTGRVGAWCSNEAASEVLNGDKPLK